MPAKAPGIRGHLSWPREWRVFGPLKSRDPLLTPERLRAIPEEIEVEGRQYPAHNVEHGNNRLDLAVLYGGVEEFRTAYVYLPLNAEKDTLATLGMGADYWMQAWLDGVLILETTDRGNVIGGDAVDVTNHLVNVRLSAGPHVLAVRFISGSGSAMLALGGPDEIRRRLRRGTVRPQVVRWHHAYELTGAMPGRTRPVATIKREVYIPCIEPGAAPTLLSPGYVGSGLRRKELLSIERSSDTYEEHTLRWSEDNGKTWGDWIPSVQKWPKQGDVTKEEWPVASVCDPDSGQIVQMVYRRLMIGKPSEAMAAPVKDGEVRCSDHMLWQTSGDDGRTWSELRELVHETAPAFDAGNWAAPGYLKANTMYGGYHVIRIRGGCLLYAATVGADHRNADGSAERVSGVICFVGRWNASLRTYEWKTSQPLTLARQVAGARGLFEPTLAELGDGRVLIEMRGSYHRWFAISNDGGMTWSPVSDLRFDNGEPFHAPSSMAWLVRSRKTGKLYWVGNICIDPPDGNWPRYPLYIAEVDEAIPALKRRSLTVIDTRDPQKESAALALSNFAVIENRETLDLEMYLTRLGELPQALIGDKTCYTANVYKYTLTLR